MKKSIFLLYIFKTEFCIKILSQVLLQICRLSIMSIYDLGTPQASIFYVFCRKSCQTEYFDLVFYETIAKNSVVGRELVMKFDRNSNLQILCVQVNLVDFLIPSKMKNSCSMQIYFFATKSAFNLLFLRLLFQPRLVEDFYTYYNR